MTIAIEAICIGITLVAIWAYIYFGIHSKVHRLLPLIMGLVALFQIYEITRLILGYDNLFWFLEDMLFLQMSYLLVFYFIDYLDTKLSIITHVIMLILLLTSDVLIFVFPYESFQYYAVIVAFSTVCILLIIGLIATSLKMRSYSPTETRTNALLGAMLLLPIVVICVDNIRWVNHGLELILSIEISIIGVSAMIWRGLIGDTRFILNDSVFTESDVPMMLFDQDYYFMAANDKAKKVFSQYDLERPTLKKTLPDRMALSEMVYRANDGEEVKLGDQYYRWQISKVINNGQSRGFIVQLIDITDEKNEIKQIELQKIAAEEQSVMKARFLAVSSHELRSPLHAIIGISQILSDKKELSYQERRMAAHINSSGNSLLKIVNSILDFSKLESGTFELSNRTYDLLPLLTELAQISLVNLGKKPVLFSIEVVSTYPAYLIGDELRIREMFQNVLSNAIKFTNEGEIRCRIEFQDVENGTIMTCIVKDTGSGMSENVIGKIFDDYSSFAAESVVEGTGLGLSVVSQFAKLMGGDAWAESDGVSGSTVGFTIFQGVSDDTESRPPICIDQFSINDYKKLGTVDVVPTFCYPDARVLVVDDMEINRQIIKELMAPWLFTMDEACDGTEGVEMAKKGDYDIIILDLLMPTMNGDETAKEIREFSNVPLILMSANLFDDTKDDYLDKGFNAILPKPLEMMEVKTTLERLLPKEKAVRPDEVSKDMATPDVFNSLESKLKTLQTFSKELSDTALNIEKIFMMDINLFQTRVHGIKGAAKQLGYSFIAIRSEIMEMAAKAGHIGFIENFISDYANELQAAVDEIEPELSLLERELKADDTSQFIKPVGSKVRVNDLFEDLLDGFEKFSMDKVEEAIKELQALSLTEEDQAILEKAIEAMDDFEYEEGVKILQSR